MIINTLFNNKIFVYSFVSGIEKITMIHFQLELFIKELLHKTSLLRNILKKTT